MPESDYARADRFCDIVMKGGITSGIVYPAAVCTLARRYRFRSIGGTSAGAIAAAVTAAAEVGRRTGKGSSFAELEKLPAALGQPAGPGRPSRLFTLFQPQAATDALFKTLTSGVRGKRGILPLVGAAIQNYVLYGLLGAAPVLLLLGPGFSVANLLFGNFAAAILSWVPWVLLAFVGAAIGISIGLALDLRKVPSNFYGLCTGMGTAEALTPWLDALLQRLAGKPQDQPLTFGDLWGDDPARRDVGLQMMTTCLTFGRPYRLPFAEHEERLFYFRRADFEKLFPKAVVDWMAARARPEPERHAADEFIPLPPARDLPVLVAARMSLSFPFLISAVPLYAIDFSRPKEQQKPEPCWFSDGGISSNFPVHFFDAPLPAWPTFAISLRYGDEAPKEPVSAPDRNVDGIGELFARFERRGLLGFLGAVFESMQNWQDNVQSKMPGYRDRVVHVNLGPGEGGLNLEMPEPAVRAIADRGEKAGALLGERFAPGSPATLNWENHRWVRFRSTMATLEGYLGRIGERLDPAWTPPQPGDAGYAALLARPTAELPSYAWESAAQREEAIRAAKELHALAASWAKTPATLAQGAPRPTPELRARPRI
jgi:hypothetical protein